MSETEYGVIKQIIEARVFMFIRADNDGTSAKDTFAHFTALEPGLRMGELVEGARVIFSKAKQSDGRYKATFVGRA